MTSTTSKQPTARQMHHEAQNYRTSLEALVSVGRSLLLTPSMESESADSFKVLAENVLEQANHEDDLLVVDGVTEPRAQVELIMQDVLTPRLTEVSEIEEALAEKADSEAPVPFTTRDNETAAPSLESLAFRAEALGLFHENIATVRTVISMEGITVDAVRPLVMCVAKRMEPALIAASISMEELEQTQVLGEMSEAVDRIEQLVNTAKESAEEACEAARSEAEALGSEGDDRIGQAIEQHRNDNPSGAHLDSGVKETTVPNDTPDTQELNLDTTGGVDDDNVDDNGSIGQGDNDGSNDGGDGTDLTGGTDGDLTDNADDVGADDTTGVDGEGADLTGLDDADDDLDETAAAAAAAAELENEMEDTGDTGSTDDDTTGTDDNTATGTDENEEEEEEEDDDAVKALVSTESAGDPFIIDNIANRYQDVACVIEIVGAMMGWLSEQGMLTADGQAVLDAGIDNQTVLDTNSFTEKAGDVLIKHYDVWLAGSLEEGTANLRALEALLEI